VSTFENPAAFYDEAQAFPEPVKTDYYFRQRDYLKIIIFL